MAGITKGMHSIDAGEQRYFDVKSGLSDVYISNSSSSLDIYVTLALSLPESQASTEILSGVKIPPNVTLNVLEKPLKLIGRGSTSPFKAVISYTSTPSTNNMMTVTYNSQ